jgi:hypothetical protein
MTASTPALPPQSIRVSVVLNWKRRGAAMPHFPPTHPELVASWDKIRFSWPRVRSAAGLYRITIIDSDDADFRWIYIGESARIESRLYDYANRLYRSKPKSTSSRLTVLIRTALIKGDAVYLDTTSNGKLLLGDTERKLRMKEQAERQFAEAAAALQEEELAGYQAWVLNKVLDDNGRDMWTQKWDLPEITPAAP